MCNYLHINIDIYWCWRLNLGPRLTVPNYPPAQTCLHTMPMLASVVWILQIRQILGAQGQLHFLAVNLCSLIYSLQFSVCLCLITYHHAGCLPSSSQTRQASLPACTTSSPAPEPRPVRLGRCSAPIHWCPRSPSPAQRSRERCVVGLKEN